jgi:hypothetical protein
MKYSRLLHRNLAFCGDIENPIRKINSISQRHPSRREMQISFMLRNPDAIYEHITSAVNGILYKCVPYVAIVS